MAKIYVRFWDAEEDKMNDVPFSVDDLLTLFNDPWDAECDLLAWEFGNANKDVWDAMMEEFFEASKPMNSQTWTQKPMPTWNEMLKWYMERATNDVIVRP